jgi:ABC-type lipoprotein release transport system permease subunit
MYLRLAWRNIWRNKRRTLITVASVFFAVVLAIFMRSATEGVYENMIRNLVSFSSGYLQIHGKGYWDERSLDNSLELLPDLLQAVRDLQSQQSIPRLESFSLLSTGEKTKGVLVMCIDPGTENEVTQLKSRLIAGQYLDEQPGGIMLSAGLSEAIGARVGDTLVLIGQGYHASTAAGKFAVTGIVRLASPELDGRLVYLHLQAGQEYFSSPGMATSVSFMLSESGKLEGARSLLEARLDTSRYEVMTWQEMMPEMDQFIQADRAGHYISIGILYLVISFGLFGTILMMTAERRHEFGMLVAIGMKKHLLAAVVTVEVILLGLTGAVAGMVAATPLVSYFHRNPIRLSGDMQEVYERFGLEPVIPIAQDFQIFLSQSLVVLTITVILSVYPAIWIARMRPIEAITN